MAEVPRTPHDIASDLARQYPSTLALNEADTRHQVIDVILHEVLSWPRSAVRCESFIDPGYADYVLLGHQDSEIFFIEAKKEGSYFTLPAVFDQDQLSAFVKMKTLLTDESLRSAIEQVRDYCTNHGCEHAAVTNGHQWVFFKTFERQRDWRNLNAFLILDLGYFSDRFSEATNDLGYVSITEKASLQQLLGPRQAGQREVFYPKTKVTAYNLLAVVKRIPELVEMVRWCRV